MTRRSGNRRSSDPEDAPGDLGTIQAFLNTVDRRKEVDKLGSPRVLASFLTGVGLLPPNAPLTNADLARALAVREGLRSVIVARLRGDHPKAAAALLDKAASESGLRVRFGDDGVPHLEPMGNGFEAVLGRLFAAVTTAHDDGQWPRLKVCADPRCQVAFYDHSDNLGARWCTPRCGNRVNARFYRRKK
jgi:predicted RNA-binding Zn ribbon-like protein